MDKIIFFQRIKENKGSSQKEGCWAMGWTGTPFQVNAILNGIFCALELLKSSLGCSFAPSAEIHVQLIRKMNEIS